MKIIEIKVDRVDECIWGNFDRQFKLRFINPINAIDPDLTFKDWFWDLAVSIVQIRTDEGHTGIGWCEDGTGAVEAIINNHLHRFVVGQDPFDYEGIWERMFRASIVYGRKGAAIEAISAIDIALWDLMGKATGKSVAALLGGSSTESIPAYASGLHHVEPELAAEEATDYVNKGYTAMKARLGYGPLEGRKGMLKNVEHIAAIRKAIGPEVGLMIDAYGGWNLPYASEMCQLLEPYNLSWVEEPFLPDDLKSYARLRETTTIPVAGGEHEFTRYGFQQMIEAKAVDILQPDLHRCGGITEGRKIASLAAVHGLSICPHAFSNVHTQFIAATTNAPMSESFPVPCWEDSDLNEQPTIILNQASPEGGKIPVSTAPGLGIEINTEILNKSLL